MEFNTLLFFIFLNSQNMVAHGLFEETKKILKVDILHCFIHMTILWGEQINIIKHDFQINK